MYHGSDLYPKGCLCDTVRNSGRTLTLRSMNHRPPRFAGGTSLPAVNASPMAAPGAGAASTFVEGPGSTRSYQSALSCLTHNGMSLYAPRLPRRSADPPPGSINSRTHGRHRHGVPGKVARRGRDVRRIVKVRTGCREHGDAYGHGETRSLPVHLVIFAGLFGPHRNRQGELSLVVAAGGQVPGGRVREDAKNPKTAARQPRAIELQRTAARLLVQLLPRSGQAAVARTFCRMWRW